MPTLAKIRDAMNQPVGALVGRGDPRKRNLKLHAQQILEQAKQDAQNSGRNLEDVLSDYGFAVPGTATPTTQVPAGLQAALAGWDPDAVLAANPSVVADRAAALGRPTPAFGGGDPWWRSLLVQGWTPEWVVGVASLDPHVVGPKGGAAFTSSHPAGAAKWTADVARHSGLGRAKAPRAKVPATLERFPTEWVQVLGWVPLRNAAGKTLVAAQSAPSDAVIQHASASWGTPLSFQIATAEQIAAWSQAWSRQSHAPPPMEVQPVVAASSASNLAGLPAPRLIDALLVEAFRARATDVHLEPTRDGGQVRFRIDGLCHSILQLPEGNFRELVARVKVLCDLDVTERRRPQDGQFSVQMNSENRDFRVATVPAKDGEKVAIRIAGAERRCPGLDEIGMSEAQQTVLQGLVRRPFGLLLATGPVGSGKTTTLYGCLQALDRAQTNVMSIEDPVEIRIEGVTQLNVNYGTGFDFVSGLRALLRQDPDAILLGEVRDEETARIAVRASMTGLRVFSTLHTHDAVGAVTALRNLGLGDHLVAASLSGIVAQRLLRKLCDDCKAPAKATAAERRLLGLPARAQVFTAQGCQACEGRGYRGRVGVFELLPVSPALRQLVLSGAGEQALRDQAHADGAATLQQDGAAKVAAGLTSVAEYRRVLDF
jgi:type II secretory ATPase GspE/PulE/Tfp pilus assembly ATPase PilB-like protein